MSFPKQQKHDFTIAAISALSPGQPGIYGIFNHIGCIYIEKAEDIRERLLQQVNGQSIQSACISKNDPQYWLAVIVGKQQLCLWESILLREFQPVCINEPVKQRQNR